MTDSFEILNLPHTATKAEIRKAYRELARRWHPDRFLEGPERDWANERMAQINAAYRQCLSGNTESTAAEDEHSALERARELIREGRYHRARQQLMGITMRCAEWNYLFGLVLLNRRDFEKAKIYLGIAVHQAPDERDYVLAYERACAKTGKNLLEKLGLFTKVR